jgi:hypothetical protein
MCSGVLFGVRSEAELLPRERVFRVVAPGTVLPSRFPGNVFSEPLQQEIFVFLFLSSGKSYVQVQVFVCLATGP